MKGAGIYGDHKRKNIRAGTFNVLLNLGLIEQQNMPYVPYVRITESGKSVLRQLEEESRS